MIFSQKIVKKIAKKKGRLPAQKKSPVLFIFFWKKKYLKKKNDFFQKMSKHNF